MYGHHNRPIISGFPHLGGLILALSLGDAPATERSPFGGSLGRSLRGTVEKHLWNIWEFGVPYSTGKQFRKLKKISKLQLLNWV